MKDKSTWIFFFCLMFCSNMLFAQCYPDRHNTSHNSSWVSCSASQSPNPANGSGYWMMYDLAYVYHLNETHWWNHNDPESLNNGVNNLKIEVSIDGINWQLAEQFVLPMANGSSIYEGYSGIDLGGMKARYVLITALDNHGGSCYALGELRMQVGGENDCTAQLNLTGSIDSDSYLVSQIITADGIVANHSTVYFQAGQEVTLESGFEIQAGAVFEARTKTCVSN